MADFQRKSASRAFQFLVALVALVLAVLVFSQAQFTLFIVTHDHDGAVYWSPALRVATALALVLTALPLARWGYTTFLPNRRYPRPSILDTLGLLVLGILGSLAAHIGFGFTQII